MSSTAWPLLLVTIGFVLLVAEVFIPSGGVLGVVSLGMIVWGIWTAFEASFAQGAGLLLAVLLLAPLAMLGALQVWPRTPIGRRMVLQPPRADDPVEVVGPRLDLLIGRLARATTPLRPSGRVECDGEFLEALAESGLIPTGASVVVVGLRAGALVVREADPPRNP